MDNYTIRFIYDRKNETTFKDGKKKGVEYKETALVQIEVRQDKTSKRAFVSTHVKVRPDQIQLDNPFKIKNHELEKSLTRKALNIMRQVEAFVASDRCKTIADVKLWDKDDQYINESVIDFIKREALRDNEGKALSTIKNVNAFISRLEEYGKIKTFKDITYSNILDFDAFLKKTINSQPTLHKRHKYFERYIKLAIRKGISVENPYQNIEIKRGKHKDPTFLTESELQKLIAYVPGNSKLERVKDLFLFQCFTGLAYVDMQAFSKDDVVDINEAKAIRSSRTKTDESFILFFFPEAEAIAEKYDYKLPIISNQKYNSYLELVGAGAGLNKKITSHVARHTFATYLINKGVPIESVSKALGHSNIRQTQRYAQLVGTKVIDDMKKIQSIMTSNKK